MKHIVLIIIVLQSNILKAYFNFNDHITIKHNYVLEEELGFKKTLIPFYFGTAKTDFSQEEIYKIPPVKIRKIIYIYSLNKDEGYQKNINENRRNSLLQLFGKRVHRIHNVMFETIIIDKKKLNKNSFNGFVVVSELSSKENLRRLSSVLGKDKESKMVKQGFQFDTISSYGYIMPHVYSRPVSNSLNSKNECNVVNVVMERNSHWRNSLIVLDVTGSMTPYIGQYLLWLKLNFDEKRKQNFVFFNDGNNNYKKTIGETGGIYFSGNNLGYEHIVKTIKLAMKNGGGGDCPENNIEAVIKGIKRNRANDIDEVIMIADNFATPRDIRLIKKVKKPLRIIMCGAYDGKVNLEYLKLARKSGGSIHTIEKDLKELIELKEGEEFTIGGSKYVIKDGEIVLIELD